MLLLWDKLKAIGFKYLFTRRLCQDAPENYFGSVRQQDGNSINPTAIQFKRAFKKLYAVDFLRMNWSNNLSKKLRNSYNAMKRLLRGINI
jgi:hypothetical protein